MTRALLLYVPSLQRLEQEEANARWAGQTSRVHQARASSACIILTNHQKLANKRTILNF